MTTPSSLCIEGGRIVDPEQHRDEVGDLYIENGVIAPRPHGLPPTCVRVDARGLTVVPGLWDIHVHLREPGGEAAETVASGSEAAARGGFTTIVGMPNTTPALDTPERVADILEKGRATGCTRVMTTSCITRDRAGEVLAPLAELASAGAIAFTDDGCTVQDDRLMRAAMETARDLERLIMDHAQDQLLERRGVMHEGGASRRAGLPGIPSEAEVKIIRRDAMLAQETGCRVHVQHMTAAGGVAILADARGRGARMTGELTPHHLVLSDAEIDPANANFKMNPPLRSPLDRATLERGLLDGIIDIFATDHAPHPAAAKERGFLEAPFGIVGLETAIGVTYTHLVKSGKMSLPAWVERWTVGPATVLGLEPPSLATGKRADVAVLNLASEWTIRPAEFASKSRNTPFAGRTVHGRAIHTILEGRTVWQEGA